MDKKEIDCGDNSCLFATNKTGMRTNGGCRCFEAHGFHRSALMSAQQILPEILSLREKIYYQDIIIDTIREMKDIDSEAHSSSIAMRSAMIRTINAFNTFKKLYPDNKCGLCLPDKPCNWATCPNDIEGNEHEN